MSIYIFILLSILHNAIAYNRARDHPGDDFTNQNDYSNYFAPMETNHNDISYKNILPLYQKYLKIDNVYDPQNIDFYKKYKETPVDNPNSGNNNDNVWYNTGFNGDSNIKRNTGLTDNSVNNLKHSNADLENETLNNLSQIINKLTVAIKNLNAKIMNMNGTNKKENKKYIDIKIPLVINKNRFKRNAENDTVELTTEKSINSDPVTTITTTTINDNVMNNDTMDNESVPKRRILNYNQNNLLRSKDIKNKLLSYLEEIFEEIKTKIEPLDIIKRYHSNDNPFKIGYILSNIDMLEANIDNLKKDVDANKSQWDDEKVIDMLDRFKNSKRAITELLDILKEHLINNITRKSIDWD